MTATLIHPFTVNLDLADLVLEHPDVHNVRQASAMRGYYRDAEALERLIAQDTDPVHYETYEKRLPEENGHLHFCVSKIRPGTIGGECFMTRGHYHTRENTGEVYFCLQGRGCIVMKTRDGAFDTQRVARGAVVYVPPFWAHRSVNTGSEPFAIFCVWPGDAGHNYADIERDGFPKRVYLRDGREVIE